METPALDLRKAAVLLACLDDQTARQLFRRLDPADQKRLAAVAGTLGPIEPRERDAIVAEFDAARRSFSATETPDREAPEDAAAATSDTWDGIELAGSLGRTLGHARRDAAGNASRRATNGRSVERAVALLAALPAAQAADMLARWDANLRVSALRRLLDAEQDQASSSNGPSLLAKILAAAPAETAQEWLELAGDDGSEDDEPASATLALPPPAPSRESPATDDLPGASGEIGEQLARLDDASLAAVLRSVDVQVAVVALAGCDPSLSAKLLERLPPRESQLVAYELEHLTGVRVADVEAAQAEIARHVRGLLGAVRVTAD